MGDSKDNHRTPGIPAWQREQQQQTDTEEPQARREPASSQGAKDETAIANDRLEVARRFLQDDEIKDAPRERKEEFLKTKGLASSEIEQLLGGSSSASEPAPAESTPAATTTTPTPAPAPPTTATAAEHHSTPDYEEAFRPRQSDTPPVVTYPEFLTKPARPPPLITANGIFNIAYAFVGLSTLLYGTSKFVVAPMVESLTEARAELHDTTSQKLSKLIDKLESTVSEIPSSSKKTAAAEPYEDDASDDIDDPSELFHRDVGTQTSIPSTPRLGEAGGVAGAAMGARGSRNETVCEKQTRMLADMHGAAKRLTETCVSEADDMADIKSSMDMLKDQLLQLTYPASKDFSSSGLYSFGVRSNEPEDEIRKAKDNIRRVKGVLLSTRNFPTSVR